MEELKLTFLIDDRGASLEDLPPCPRCGEAVDLIVEVWELHNDPLYQALIGGVLCFHCDWSYMKPSPESN